MFLSFFFLFFFSFFFSLSLFFFFFVCVCVCVCVCVQISGGFISFNQDVPYRTCSLVVVQVVFVSCSPEIMILGSLCTL